MRNVAARHGNPPWEYKGVQALRAVAALAVVFGHSMNFLGQGRAVLPSSLEEFQGAIGVDIFFVISGFVMAISAPRLLAHSHPTRTFLWRRLLRIAPLYWLLTIVKLITLAAIPSLSVHGFPSAWNAIASFLFLPSRNPAGEIRPVIPVGWTLNFEMLFYLLFAYAFPRPRGLQRILLPALGLLAAIGILHSPTWPTYAFLADPIVLEFAAGVGVALLAQSRRLPSAPWAWVAVLLGTASILLLKPGLSLLTQRVLWWGIPAVLIVLGTVALEPVLCQRLPRWLLLLGSASYSIYLVQTFVFPVVDAAASHLLASSSTVSPLSLGTGIVAASLASAALAGTVTHLVLERPMTALIKQTLGTDRVAPIARET